MDTVDWFVLVGLMAVTVIVVGDYLPPSIAVGIVTAIVTLAGYLRYQRGRRAEAVAWFAYLVPIFLFPLTYAEVDNAETAVIGTTLVVTIGLAAAKFGYVSDERGNTDTAENAE
ncbi:hypothetical protein AArcCO_2817 [Halalkaliarchaeum sp. AArc-CO]|uniref:hypothetical protein n=1 Tax=unclassified Halalkaliarchaeum TaxID=2678344 RepID=UPI00217D31F9|nr:MULTISPECIES: hypothetical protein [unclassified Halalkaliarchaeum]MDR5673713.1 hypothetical protein [Halalkaliarchaeum sp. AArc-GB]UWG52094.1 hypothetical protein AArcCO_2817 [Halalkaliarchaeum sp. AArc-CO]